VAVIISSCQKFYEKTIPKLLESMDVPLEHIHIVVGECSEASDGEFMGCRIHFRRWANFDNNALIWAASAPELYKYTWVFNLHDTCECEPGFWTKIQPQSDYELYDAVKLISHDYSMCIGLYRTSFLRRMRSNIDELKSYIPGSLSVKANTEDRIFNMSSNLTSMKIQDRVPSVVINPYGSDTERLCEYFPSVGIYKYKANCGSIHCINL